MLTRLLINWPYKLAALFIALALKWEVAETNHPHSEKSINLPVTIKNVPSNLVVTDCTSDVDLVLSGTGASLDAVAASSYTATVSLDGEHAGANQPVRIDVEAAPGVPSDVSFDTPIPQYANVTLEDDVKQRLPLSVTFDRVAPSGLSFGSATVIPGEAIVEGPKSAVSRVVRLIVDGSEAVNGQTLTPGDPLMGLGAVLAVDAEQNPVDGVTVTPERVLVKVPVSRQAGTKQVLVNALVSGRPTYPWVVKDIDVEPDTVAIQGTPDALATYSVIPAEPIDISGANGDITRLVPIKAPPGISMISPTDVSVTIRISNIASPYPAVNQSGSSAGSVHEPQRLP